MKKKTISAISGEMFGADYESPGDYNYSDGFSAWGSMKSRKHQKKTFTCKIYVSFELKNSIRTPIGPSRIW